MNTIDKQDTLNARQRQQEWDALREKLEQERATLYARHKEEWDALDARQRLEQAALWERQA